jgi:choline dehydrogenase
LGLTTARTGQEPLGYPRARVIGGCSAINGCVASWGSSRDYDAWADAGCIGWSARELEPLFEEVTTRFQARVYRRDELTPYQRAWVEAGPIVGIPEVADLNALDGDQGIAPSAFNIVDGVRWNAAFAFLDPVRSRPNLQICGEALVDRLNFSDGRLSSVEVIVAGKRRTIATPTVILCAVP